MPHRTRNTTALLAALGAVALGATPTVAQEYTWTPDRPDSWASPGIFGDRTLAGGEVMVWYRFHEGRGKGLQIGKQTIGVDDLTPFYPIVPLRRTTRMHEGGLALSPADRLTLVARGTFLLHSMDELGSDGFIYRTESSGVGDVAVEALVDVYGKGPYRAHLGMGVSIPVGSITERANGATGGTFLLPYILQTGSGTPDLLPSGTILAMNEHGSVGLQGRGTIRLGENDRGYRLGHGAELVGWGATRLNDYFSVSAGIAVEHWGRMQGADPELDFELSPSEDAQFWGGTFVDLPVGVNLFVRDGLLAGHRLGVEARWPISQDTEGPQLRRDLRVTARWQTGLSLF